MLVNLTDIFMSQGKKTEMQVVQDIKIFDNGIEEFAIKDISPLTLVLTNVEPQRALVSGNIQVTVTVNCDRCLKELDKILEIEFTREVVSPEIKDEDLMEDQMVFMEGYQLNIENLISNEILMNWPTKVLCIEDCKGICNVCGMDLNAGNCQCDTFVPDPRMAKIKDIFNANKEV